MQLLFFPPSLGKNKGKLTWYLSSICSHDMQWIKMGEAHLLKLSKQEQVISLLLTCTTDLLQEGCSSTGWIFLDNNKNTLWGKWQERAPRELVCLPWTQSHPQLIWSLVSVGEENSWGLCWYLRREGRILSHLSGYKGPSILSSHGCSLRLSLWAHTACLCCSFAEEE